MSTQPVAPPKGSHAHLYHWTFLVHLWTFTGIACAAFALKAALEGAFDTAARLLVAVLVVDFTDGTLTRLLRVKERMPLISGDVIDYVHDLLGLTFVPMIFFWKAGLFLEPYGFALVVITTLAATLKYSMKGSLLRLGYSLGAPPVFLSIILCYFLELGPAVSTLYTVALIVLVLLPVRFPITSLVTTHWKPGWQSVTNYLVFLCALPILIYLKDAPKLLSIPIRNGCFPAPRAG